MSAVQRRGHWSHWSNEIAGFPTIEFTPALVRRFWASVRIGPGCWEWLLHCKKNGYGRFPIRSKPYVAARVAFEILVGPIPPGLGVLHHCDNPRCVRPDHLYVGDQKQNSADMIARQRHKVARGEMHANSKLTAPQVRAIRERYRKGGISQQALADEFGVSQPHVSLICRLRLWKSGADKPEVKS